MKSIYLSLVFLPVFLPLKLNENSNLITPVFNDNIIINFSEEHCREACDGDVNTYTVKDGWSDIGHSIWISRASEKVNAKYFAHKQSMQVVHDRYNTWRDGKYVVLKSSGAYATGWNGSDLPAGITVDNGIIVNRDYQARMDGLVIVYATGGIAITNIEDGDLYLKSLGKRVDVSDSYDRGEFLQWAVSEDATVFQTHLLVYDNRLQFTKDNGERAKRKFLILAKDSSGELFHIIFYTKEKAYSLYNAARNVLQYMKRNKSMNIIAMVNLDTGGYDNLHTGGSVRDCDGNFITGTSTNYGDMTNLLTYSWTEDE